MRVKKYQAVDMPEALEKIKADLGPDAVILSTREMKPGKGVFGMLGRPILEVTAATDVETLAHATPPRTEAARPRSPESPGAMDHGAFLTLRADMDSLREELDLLARRGRPAPAPDASTREIRALVEKVEHLVSQTTRLAGAHLPPGLARLRDHLEAIDVDGPLAARILAFLQEKIDGGQVAQGREGEAFRELAVRTVRVGGGIEPGSGGPRVVVFVGPTGVGKTTTVAKLAARYALQEGRRVGLVSVDTFRIAAVEQLKTYAGIMGVPFRVAVDAAGFQLAVDDLADRDLVLVDTAGQSPQDEESLAELLTRFPDGVPMEVHLVVSVTTRSRDLERILGHYAPVRPTKLVLTKLDETRCHGPLIGLPLAARLPISYLTTGQNVPDDIEEATAEAVAEYLTRGLEGAP